MSPDTVMPAIAPARISILARIAPAMSYGLTAIGAAGSAFLLINVIRAMRDAEAAGIAAVSAGISEANLVIVVTLYLAIVLGLIGVVVGFARMFVTTTTASPSAWFYFITGVLGFIPMLALWQAQSLLLGVIFARSGGNIATVARQITLLLMLALIVGLVSAIVLLVASVIPLPRILRARRKWAPPVVLLVMEIVVIVMTVLYHMRTAWLYEQYQQRF